MKKTALILTAILVFTMIFAFAAPAFADDEKGANGEEQFITTATGDDEYAELDDYAEMVKAVPEAESNPAAAKAISAGAVIAVVAAAGAIAMAVAISRATDAMARQPEMAGKINSAMMLGLVFIETAIIYALIVAILIIFVL